MNGPSLRFDVGRFKCTLAFIVRPAAPCEQSAEGTVWISLWPHGLLVVGNGSASVEIGFLGVCAYFKAGV